MGLNNGEKIVPSAVLQDTTPVSSYTVALSKLSLSEKKLVFEILINQLDLLFTLAAESIGTESGLAVTKYDGLINVLRKNITTSTISLAPSQDALLLLNLFDAQCAVKSPKINHKLLNEMLKIRQEATSLVRKIAEYSIKQDPNLKDKFYIPTEHSYSSIQALFTASKEFKNIIQEAILERKEIKDDLTKLEKECASLKHFSYVNRTLLDFSMSTPPLLKEYATILNELKNGYSEDQTLSHYCEVVKLPDLFSNYSLETLKEIALILRKFFEGITTTLENQAPQKNSSSQYNLDEALISAIKKNVLEGLAGETDIFEILSCLEEMDSESTSQSSLIKASFLASKFSSTTKKEKSLLKRISCEPTEILLLMEKLQKICPALHLLIHHHLVWKSENIGLLELEDDTNQHGQFFSHTFTLAPFFIHLYKGIMKRITVLEKDNLPILLDTKLIQEKEIFSHCSKKNHKEKKIHRYKSEKKRKISEEKTNQKSTTTTNTPLNTELDAELERFNPLVIKRLLENKEQTEAESKDFFLLYSRWGSGIHSQATIIIEKDTQKKPAPALLSLTVPSTNSLNKSDLFHKTIKRLLKKSNFFEKGSLIESSEYTPCNEYHITLTKGHKAVIFPGILFLGSDARTRFKGLAKIIENNENKILITQILQRIKDTGKHTGAGVCIFDENKKVYHSCFHEKKPQ